MTTPDDALLPCPFCGSDVVGFRHRGLPDTQAGCNDCGTSGAWHGNRTQAIAAWNRRAGQSHAAGLLMALGGMVLRQELYAGDFPLGQHDLALLDQARAAIAAVKGA